MKKGDYLKFCEALFFYWFLHFEYRLFSLLNLVIKTC